MTVDHAIAVQDIAERMYGNYQRWADKRSTPEGAEAFSSMCTGLGALQSFGYAQDWKMLGGRQLDQRFRKIRERFPDLQGNPNRIPTEADIAEAREWQAKLRVLLLQEFAPELVQ